MPNATTLHRTQLAVELATVAAAMVAFALFAHRGLPTVALSALALLVAAAAIARSALGVPEPLAVLGVTPVGPRVVPFAVVGLGLGALAGLLQRAQLGVDSASGVEPFVVLACLIGATEELVFRGWLQGRGSAFGWPVAILFAALAHGGYKTALFAWPPDSLPVAYDLVRLGLWTAAGGLVLGALRVWSRSLLPAVLGHVAFDAVVYASYRHAPWWVWS